LRLLITGGAGFIGSNLIRYILSKYPTYDVVNYDCLTYAGNLQNISDFNGYANYCFIQGDIRDRKQVANTVAQYQINGIINLAAETHVDRSIRDASIFVDTNVMGTYALLDVALRNRIRKFVQISTDEVYGSVEHGYCTEDSPLAPNSPYAASKVGGDMLVRSFYQTYGLPVNIIRSSNNYGPCQHPEKFIPRMILHALQDKELPIYGDGLNRRDWLHVSDHCQAIDRVLHHGIAGEVYNVGGQSERSNLEVARTILRSLNRKETRIQFIADRLGHDRRYGLDSTKIRKNLKWEQDYPSFETGLEQTIKWYIKYPT